MGSVSEANFSVQSEETTGFESPRKERPLGVRERIPAIGLFEYWYPALKAHKVPWKKPVEATLLGKRLVFFRDAQGEVVALQNTCPHRGVDLSKGDCQFKGTLTCPYHAWVFDAQGECVAVLSEGPDSTIPGAKGTKARSYPTRTLKGNVFVWMGEGAPAPIEEDVPPELFDPEVIVMSSERPWKANWRPSIENFIDAHVFYVHRNSIEVLTQPTGGVLTVLHQGPTRPPLQSVNGRFLRVAPNTETVLDYMDRKKDDTPQRKRDFQDAYPGLGGQKWPSTRTRLYISKVCGFFRGLFKPTGPMSTNPEWTSGAHLPGTLHIDYHRWTYTRYEVPVDENNTNNFFFISWRGKTAWQRFFWPLYFHLYFNWKMTSNFSGQDAVMAEMTDYAAPERLSPTDLFLREWRRFVLDNARGLKKAAESDPARGASASA